MSEFLMGDVSWYWLLLVYIGTMIFNEGAILAAFSVSLQKNHNYFAGVFLASSLGVLTNDLILFVIAHFGLRKRILLKEDESTAKTIFQKAFLYNVFLSLLCMKFLFGMRSALTLYLVLKKKLSLKTYLLYSSCGIFLYVCVLALLGFFVGLGVKNVVDIYAMTIRIVGITFGAIVVAHAASFFIRKLRAPK